MKKGLLKAIVAAVFTAMITLPVLAAEEADEPAAACPIKTFCTADSCTTGWSEQNGFTHYFDASGKAASGECVIEGNAYTFDQNGHLIREGIHRNGLEDELLSEALVLTQENWEYSVYAIDLVNQERAKVGQPPLQPNFDLSVVAAYRCLHMNKYNYFAHDYDSIDQNNYDWAVYSRIPSSVAENIQLHGDITNPNNGVVNTETPTEQVNHSHKLLTASTGHYNNMISPLAHSVGVAIFRNEHQTRDYYTMLFLPKL